MTFTVGETVGLYRIVEQIGQGGMATVFKAYHPNLDRYVALKVLHPAFKEDAGFLERFKREAQIVARLEHPAIVPVYDYADHQGQPYLVMKFIEGETLKARLKRHALTLPETLHMFEVVAQAIHYAHEHGILHRDIKPSNIMLDRAGTPYITDFGLARIAQAGESTLSQDMMLGTPQYISPEQAQGVRDLGPETDIYSLGVVLYEILVGRVPFSADTPYAIVHDHIYKALPLPTQVNPDIPSQVERVLLKALAKAPADRYHSAVELAAALRRAVEEAGMAELSKSSLRSPEFSEALTGTTPPTLLPTYAAPPPGMVGVPMPMLQATGSSASQRPVHRRRASLWLLGGLALLIGLVGLFVIVRALADPDLRPWNSTNEAGAEETISQPLQGDSLAENLFPIFQEALDRNPVEALNLMITAIEGMTGEQIAKTARYAATAGYPELAIWLSLETLNQPDITAETRNEAGDYLYHTTAAMPARTLLVVNVYINERGATAHAETIRALALLQNGPVLVRDRLKVMEALTTALNIKPLPETYLVRGLYFQLAGEMNKARDDWQLAATSPGSPQWVVSEAERLLNQN